MRFPRSVPNSTGKQTTREHGHPRVLILITTDQRRGAEIEGFQLGQQLREQNWATDVYALTTSKTENKLDIPVIGRKPLGLTTLWKLRRLGKRHDVVLAYGSTTLPACSIAFFLSRTPFIYRSIGDPKAWIKSNTHRLRTGLLVRRAKKVVVLWDEAGRNFAEAYRVPTGRIVTIPNSRSPVIFHPATNAEREEARRSFGISEGDDVVLMVGALSEEKRVDLAIRAISALPNSRLLMVGDGPFRPALEELATELAPGKVIFTGELHLVTVAYHAADCYLLTSRTEGMPGAVIEAALCELPVVASNVGAMSWLFSKGVNGALIRVDSSPSEIASDLGKVLSKKHDLNSKLNESLFPQAATKLWHETLNGKNQGSSPRVLYVIDSLEPGGAETSLVAMAPHLIESGIDLHVVSLSHRNQLADKLKAKGIPVHVIDRVGSRRHNYSYLRQTIRSINPDIVHTTLFEADIAGRIAAWREEIPVISSVVNDSYSKSHWQESPKIRLLFGLLADILSAQVVDQFHFLTETTSKSVSRRLLIARKRRTVIPRGRDLDRFRHPSQEERLATRKEMGIDDKDFVILAMGRHEFQKGFDLLIRASADVTDVYENALFVIAGKDGHETQFLRELAEKSTARVRFIGHVDRPEKALATADLFCFPSRREGLGGVLVEAIAVGCPILASDIPTSAEFSSKDWGVSINFFRSGDLSDLSRQLISIINEVEPVKSKKDNGEDPLLILERVNIFGIKSVTNRFAALYRK